jgi:hypothetical protein
MCVKLRSQVTQTQFTPHLKQFINHHHISEHRTTEPFRPEKAVTNKAKVAAVSMHHTVADTYVTLARCYAETILSLVKESRCLNEREVTARPFLLPPAVPITAHWTAGDHMSKLSQSWARTVHGHGQPHGCPFGLMQGFARLATLKTVQVHLCPWYPLHMNNFTLHSTKRNKQSKRYIQK